MLVEWSARVGWVPAHLGLRALILVARDLYGLHLRRPRLTLRRTALATHFCTEATWAGLRTAIGVGHCGWRYHGLEIDGRRDNCNSRITHLLNIVSKIFANTYL